MSTFPVAEAARHARRMLDAEVALGHVVARIGIDRAGELARQIGVSRGRLVAAHQLATGAVRPHRPLERRVAGRKNMNGGRR